MSTESIALREEVRRRYAISAVGPDAGCCGSDSNCGPSERDLTGGLYTSGELEGIPASAANASLGCGNPTALAELKEGETVLDLGSGGGIDVLLSARRVGTGGFAYGLDMTDEMLDLARRNAAEAGATNVEFLKGYIEDIPLDDESVDVVISNCVINLSADKAAVFAQIHRVLRPGGRIGISDIVADDSLSPDERAERGSWVGCIAGALSVTEYRRGLAEAGFTDISLTPTHAVADGLDSMIIRAVKPGQG
ncbi:MAG TPA: arsenite methyltransferase [Acidimicrobiia bacterium]|nr:arsenite methyltransferase [Acidimicrobiia bacterium]